MKPRKNIKRYTMLTPMEHFEEVKQISNDQHISVVEILRRFIRIGLLVSRLDDDTDFVIRQNGEEKVIKLI